MASGFITLPDGTEWSSRWSRYDWVLESVMNELSEKGDEGVLKGWIRYILPDENNGDIESGYCFHKNGGESILRIIDTRLMKEEFSKIFWNKINNLSKKLPKDSDIGYLINGLNDCYKDSLKNTFESPKDMDLNEIFLLGGYNIGR